MVIRCRKQGVYEVELVKDGKQSDVSVSPEGKLISVEEKVEFDAIPAAAQTTLKEKAGKGKIGKCEKITADGKVTFEAVVHKGKKVIEYTVAEDGKFVKDEDVTDEK